MKDLPIAARLYVGAVLTAGALTITIFAPRSIDNLVLFAALLGFSSLASALKVSLPLATSGSTMSVSYAVDFLALLLLGANATMVVGATSAWSQCTFRTQTRSEGLSSLTPDECGRALMAAAGGSCVKDDDTPELRN